MPGDGVHGVMLASLINHTEHDTPEQMLIIMIIVWGRDTAHEGIQGVQTADTCAESSSLHARGATASARGSKLGIYLC